MIKLNALSEWNYEYFTMDEVGLCSIYLQKTNFILNFVNFIRKNISKSVNEAFIRFVAVNKDS